VEVSWLRSAEFLNFKATCPGFYSRCMEGPVAVRSI
jgi:hypothetical protein